MNGLDQKGTIVIVDDEEMVLTSICSLITLETDYEGMPFLSASAALEFIENNHADLVISDYLMPEMDGISFLARVRDLRPEIPRIILTGYADKENAIKAINHVGLFQYLEKPWDNDDLLIILRNGVERRNLMQRLEEKMSEVNKAHAELVSLQQEVLRTFV